MEDEFDYKVFKIYHEMDKFMNTESDSDDETVDGKMTLLNCKAN